MARIAAGIIIVAAAGIWTYQWLQQPLSPTLELVTSATTAQDTLPDGSTAFLNKKSSISYKFDKSTNTRTVALKGEGFFEVKHEVERPFVIEADEALVRDLGTSFNVKAYPGEDTVEVVVKEGVVQFYTASNPGINVNAGETGIYSKRNKSFTKIHRADTNVFAYKTGVFAFHATDLRSVIERVNEVYDARISLGNDRIGDCRLTVNFTNEQLETIVDVIAETLALQVEKKDVAKKEIVLTGPGCQ
jgi:transmembrane sensor